MGACLTCLILAINRCVEITSTYWSDRLFKGKRTLVWLIFPILYAMIYYMFAEPGFYSSLGHAWFTDPYYGMDIGNKEEVFFLSLI
jgi:nematode chemoreceptor